MVNAALWLGVVALVCCLIATPILRDLFLRYNIVDRPDGARKLHRRAVPRIGGIAIVFSYAVAFASLFAFAPQGAQRWIEHAPLFRSIWPAAAIVFLVGVLDDVLNLQPRQKMAGQLLGSLVAVAMGVRLVALPGMHTPGWILIPASVLWLLISTNAFNLIDGLDGLASGVGLFATLTFCLAAVMQHDAGLLLATVPLAVCLIAFLRYNFAPATVFLGDCGSMTIGFLLGCFGLVWSQKATSGLAMAAPIMAIAVPLIDVVVSISRRLLSSHPIFQADRGHIHYKLLAKGLSTRGAVAILYAASALAGALALAENSVSYRLRAVPLAIFLLAVVYGIHRMGYAEFRLAHKLLSRRLFLKSLRDELYLHEWRHALDSAETVEDYWNVVTTSCRQLHFQAASMCLQGRVFDLTCQTSPDTDCWEITVPLEAGVGYVRLVRSTENPHSQLMVAFLQAFQLAVAQRSFPADELAAEVEATAAEKPQIVIEDIGVPA